MNGPVLRYAHIKRHLQEMRRPPLPRNERCPHYPSTSMNKAVRGHGATELWERLSKGPWASNSGTELTYQGDSGNLMRVGGG